MARAMVTAMRMPVDEEGEGGTGHGVEEGGVRRSSNDIELPPMKSRWRCPIYVGVEVDCLLFELDDAIIACQSMPTEELFPSSRLDFKAKSCNRYQAGDDQ